MARKKDLASLAALAGLAYMASRDKGGEGSAPSTEDTEAKASPVRSGEVEETSLDKMEDIPRSRPTAPAASKPAAPMGNSGRGRMGGPTAEQAASNAGIKGKATYETPYDRMNRTNREAEAAKADAAKETAKLRSAHPPAGRGVVDTSNIDPNTLLPRRSTGMKKGGAVKSKGGSVKGWGISRGARAAKVY